VGVTADGSLSNG